MLRIGYGKEPGPGNLPQALMTSHMTQISMARLRQITTFHNSPYLCHTINSPNQDASLDLPEKIPEAR